MLPSCKGEKLMVKVRKCIKYGNISIGGGQYKSIQEKYVYEVKYPDGTKEQLADNIIDENILSKVDSEGCHYQVVTKVTDHKRYDSAITKVEGFIRSSNGNLHWKRNNRGCIILVEWKEVSVDWFPLKYFKHSNLV